MKIILTLFAVVFSAGCFAQHSQTDSITPVYINEVIIIGKKTPLYQKQPKSLTSTEDYLLQSSKVNMVKRGAYAWEPFLNNMATERTVITIDGMRIFGACTDKMDPVTSYVEVSNLSEASITSGQLGSCHGPTIGGAIDLKRADRYKGYQGWNTMLHTGYETNNKHKIAGMNTSYKDSLWYVNADFMLRDAGNYKAGNNVEVPFSQFTKYNLSGTAGYQFAKRQLVEGSVIYDKAVNVGYPALPMDVSLAQALITSLRYRYTPVLDYFSEWETKAYFNSIVHKMDDTKRPVVPIHMDMPGWSDTYGLYSKLKGKFNRQQFAVNLNAYYNRSLAEMTMYPANPSENIMFMYTWPDIRTQYTGLYLEDKIAVNSHSDITITTGIGIHTNKVADKSGLQSLQIFYPEMNETKSRILKSFAVNYQHRMSKTEYGLGLGYGERAPSVSEAYGFYLYNSNDFYDYIGNPGLKNEKSFEANGHIRYQNKNLSGKLSSTFFYIKDYYIGEINPAILPMTIGAKGVKIYNALEHALIFNTDLELEYTFTTSLKWKNQLAYSYGQDASNRNLPFISPLRYKSSFLFTRGDFNLNLIASGNVAHTNFAAFYGEATTSDYCIFTVNSGQSFRLGSTKINVQAGVENILDKYYTTYSDWNGIPRLGRNFFINASYSF